MSEHEALQVVWFLLIGVLLAGYAILDGFDLGVGFWHLFNRKDEERRALLNAIGPVWDGNEVWLLTGGGAIFAAFPHVYATVFSGLYLALMLVILGLIFRAVSVEYRSKTPSARWRKMWDMGFALGSILPALLFGVAVGNILRGLPLDEKMRFAGSFLGLLNPYALLVGVLGLAMFATHGALYLALKTDGELAARAKSWAQKAQGLYLELFIFASIVTMIIHPQLWKNYIRFPVLWIIPVLTLGAIVLIGVLSKRDQTLKAFICSGLSIAGLMGMCGAGLFPNLVPALNNPAWSLTIWNASSSALTLKTMLILALIGMPIVIAYTIWIYIIFRGKVKVEAAGY